MYIFFKIYTIFVFKIFDNLHKINFLQIIGYLFFITPKLINKRMSTFADLI
jgi:hypothetical protein